MRSVDMAAGNDVQDLVLVRRWVERRDAEAFRALVERHAGMVYATCKRLLGNPADAEDSAQECFQTLASVAQAPKTHVGAWLHRVATNRSLNRLRADARRAEREARFMADRPTVSEPDWDDLYEFVDRAIAALPDKYRGPIVAHFLEHRTHGEIAVELGISGPAVSQRIQKGIALLRRWLRQREVLVSAVTLAAMMTANLAHASAPDTLVTTLGKLALSGPRPLGTAAVPATSKPLIAGGITLMTKKSFVALCAVVVLLCALFAVYMTADDRREATAEAASPRADLGSDETAAEQGATARVGAMATVGAAPDTHASQPAPPNDDLPGGDETTGEETGEIAISGFVYDEKAYPLEGATVQLRVSRDEQGMEALATHTVTAGSDGFYAIDGVDEMGHGSVTALARGYVSEQKIGLTIDPSQIHSELNFTLAAGTFYVAGYVLEPDGSPIEDASVYLRHYGGTAQNPANGACSMGLNMGIALSQSDGYFEIAVPWEGLCDFSVMKAGFAPGFFAKIPTGSHDERFILDGGGTIAGCVSHPDGTPVAHARIEARGAAFIAGNKTVGGSPSLQIPTKSAVTDAAGRYRIAGLGTDYTYLVSLTEAPGVTAPDPVPEGLPPIFNIMRDHAGGLHLESKNGISVERDGTTVVDFTLDPRARIQGCLRRSTTGEPIPQATIWATRSEQEGGNDPQDVGMAITDEAGRYAIDIGLRAKRTVYVVPAYFQPCSAASSLGDSARSVALAPGETKELNLEAEAPITVLIRVVDEGGNPLPDILVGMEDTDSGSDCAGYSETDSEGLFSWFGLTPNRSLVAFAQDQSLPQGQQLLGWSEVFSTAPGQVPDEVTIVCQPKGGIEGVLVDEAGQALGDARCTCVATPEDGGTPISRPVATGPDGQFALAYGLPEGAYARIQFNCAEGEGAPRATVEQVRVVRDTIVDLGLLRLRAQSPDAAP